MRGAEPLHRTTSTTTRRSCRPASIPAEQVLGNAQYRPEMQGVDVPGGIYAHIAGIDIVRATATGEYYVLEDNLRVPSRRVATCSRTAR